MAQLSNQAATITKASGPITVERKGQKLELHEGDSLYSSDTIKTGAHSVEISFMDGAKAMLSSGSILTVKEFSYNNATGADASFVVNLALGAMRSISGDIVEQNPDAFKVITPRATVGIRGTTFSNEVNADSSEAFFLEQLDQGHNLVITTHEGQQLSLHMPGQGAYIAKELNSNLLPIPSSSEPLEKLKERLSKLFEDDDDIVSIFDYGNNAEQISIEGHMLARAQGIETTLTPQEGIVELTDAQTSLEDSAASTPVADVLVGINTDSSSGDGSGDDSGTTGPEPLEPSVPSVSVAVQTLYEDDPGNSVLIDAIMASVTTAPLYGDVHYDPISGELFYSLHYSTPSIQGLGKGEMLRDSFKMNVTIEDPLTGATHDEVQEFFVEIHGVDDAARFSAPVIDPDLSVTQGSATQSTISKSVQIEDIDNTVIPITLTSSESGEAIGNAFINDYGIFTVTKGAGNAYNYTFVLNNASEEVKNLSSNTIINYSLHLDGDSFDVGVNINAGSALYTEYDPSTSDIEGTISSASSAPMADSMYINGNIENGRIVSGDYNAYNAGAAGSENAGNDTIHVNGNIISGAVVGDAYTASSALTSGDDIIMINGNLEGGLIVGDCHGAGATSFGDDMIYIDGNMTGGAIYADSSDLSTTVPTGNNTIIIKGNTQGGSIYGGNGNDTINLNNFEQGSVYGGKGDDSITAQISSDGSSSNPQIHLGEGKDVLVLSAGDSGAGKAPTVNIFNFGSDDTLYIDGVEYTAQSTVDLQSGGTAKISEISPGQAVEISDGSKTLFVYFD